MGIKALVVGVCDYSAINHDDLPFCTNDIINVTKALVEGLKVKLEDIFTLGKKGIVSSTDFINKLYSIGSNLKEEDTFIFYFSGHGGNFSDAHYLMFSDRIINTQEIIGYLDSLHSKNKIVILDSCSSGNFKVGETSKFHLKMNIADFFGRGYAVISSSNANQASWGHPTKPISLFTSFLCAALTDRLLIKEGSKSLHDIKKILYLYLENWNKNNPNQIQQPIYRADLGGTILFPVEEYIPYKPGSYYDETDNYIIYDIEPSHHGIAKRYGAKIILKKPLSIDEISIVNQEIVEKVRKLEVYTSLRQEKYWKHKLANIVFCYFGRDETDLINGNYLCHTIWLDEKQDRSQWFRVSKNSEIIDGIYFNHHTYYNTLKIFQQNNTGEKPLLISQTKEIIKELILLSEKVIEIYNEFLNKVQTEDYLIEELNRLVPLIDKWYFAETELPIAPLELKSWCQACTNLAATIHNVTLIYNSHGLENRTSKNRIMLMNTFKDNYYKDLEELKKEEQVLNKMVSCEEQER